MQRYGIKWNLSSNFKQDFFFTKLVPLQSVNHILQFGFWLILLRVVSHTLLPFIFPKELFFLKFIFKWIRNWNVLICFLFENRESNKYVRSWENGGGVIKNVYRFLQEERSITPHMYVRTYTLFMFLSHGALFYL